MLRHLFVVVVFIISIASSAYAKQNVDKYHDTDIKTLTNFMVFNKLIVIDKPSQYMDYLAITECPIYSAVKDSQFRQQEIQTALAKKFDQPVKGDGILYLKLYTMFSVQDYDFKTQSMFLTETSQMKRANILDLDDSSNINFCGLQSRYAEFPRTYALQLSIPVSFYRIPVKKEIAEDIFPKLEKNVMGPKTSILYGIIYVQIEPIPPRIEKSTLINRAVLHGQLNSIELYVDKDRKALLKRLDYEGS